MASIVVTKRAGALYPVDKAGQDALDSIRPGEVAVVELVRSRNVQHHRLFWALLTLVAENSPDYDSPEQVLIELKLALGHVEPVVGEDGRTYFIPKSISFAKMDQSEFAMFFDRCVDIIANRFIPGIPEETLRREAMEMIGIGAPT